MENPDQQQLSWNAVIDWILISCALFTNNMNLHKQIAGENGSVHDHWVDSIGDDIILDFNKSEGDKIEIKGHTVKVEKICI